MGQTVKIMEGTVFDGTQKDKTRYSDKTDERVWGNHFLNPPRDYVPDNMKSGTTSVVCDVEFEVEDSLDEHIRSIHKDVVKKTFSNEAFEVVMKSEDYTEWLKNQVKKTRGR